MTTTPRPWIAKGRHVRSVDEFGGFRVAEARTPEDAELIARTATTHGELVAALEAILLQVCQGSVFERDACITQARSALRKARGEPS